MAQQVAVAKRPAKRPFRHVPPKEEVIKQQESGNIEEHRVGEHIDKLFTKFDTDGNGFVSIEELKEGLATWGIHISKESEDIIKKIFKHATNANREEFDEIMRFFLKIRTNFTKFDTDKSNTIGKAELPKFFQEFDYKFPQEALKEFVTFFDTDHSGELDWMEVVELMLYILYMHTLFTKEDKDKSGALSPPELQALLRALNLCVTVKETEVFLRKVPAEKRDAITFEWFIELLLDMKENLAEIRSQAQEERAATRVARTVNNLGKRKLFEGEAYEKELKAHMDMVEKLRASLRASGKKFEDQDFPCNSSFHFPTNDGAASAITEWKRYTDFENASLFKSGVDQGDVLQGSLGDCWFLSALCVLAGQGHGILEDLFISCDPPTGTVNVRIFKNGKWNFVLIDDRIPCSYSGKPSFGCCRDPNELWVPLLEKAYAKLHGNFEAIEAGSITDGLVDLTGEVSENGDIKNVESTWTILRKNVSEGYLMGCAAHSSGASVEQETPLGILMLHAYGILKAEDINGLKLLQIRNPWGHHEWKGRWSDGSKEWTPELMKKLDVKFEDDGTFWMEFHDFCENFNKLYVLRILTDEVGEVWTRNNFTGEWKGETAGGCLNNPSWKNNPQYYLKTATDSKVFVSLRQSDLRMVQKKAPTYDAIGFAVLVKGDESMKKKERITSKNDLLVMSPFFGGREVSLEFEVKGGVSYVVIPSYFDAKIEGKFWFSIFTVDQSPIVKDINQNQGGDITEDLPLPNRPGASPNNSNNKRTELPPRGAGGPATPQPAPSNQKKFAIKGKWEGKTAGGCPNTIAWRQSPQYILNVSSKSRVEIVLTQTKSEKEGKYFHIGFLVLKSELPSKKRKFNTRELIHQSEFINSETVHADLDLDAGSYNVLACTYHPNLETSFEISVSGPGVSSARDFYELTPDVDWKISQVSDSWKPGKDGGCSNNPSTWTQNPHFAFVNPQKQSVRVVVETEIDTAVGFYLYTTKDGKTVGESVGVSQFVRGLSVGRVTSFKDFELEPGRYVIRATTLDAKVHGNFTVQLLADKQACVISTV